MYKHPLLLLLVFSCIIGFGQDQLSKETQAFVAHPKGIYMLQNLTLIDGTANPARYNQDILIKNETIEKIGVDLSVPEDAIVINLEGKSAMPGMVMLHEHLFYPKTTPGTYGVDQMSYSFPKLYLAGGVTSMRTAGSIMPQADINIKKAILRGQTPGPNMDVTSPHLDREGVGIYELGYFESTEQAIKTVNFYADMGVTSFKVYNFITKADLKAIVTAAHARNMKVTGHLCSITYREAADIGIDNIEHGFYSCSDFISDKISDECQPFKMNSAMLAIDTNAKVVSDLIQHLVAKKVALTSTINVFEPYTDREVVPGGGLAALYPRAKEKVYQRWANKQGKDSLDYVRFTKAKVWEKRFYEAGGLLVAGTDPTYDGRIVAGYANMRLLELFVEMGFSIPQAIQICTLNGAIYLEQDNTIGTLESSKIANIVIMNGDISADISAIRTIETVFKNGIGYDSKKLFASAKGLVGIR